MLHKVLISGLLVSWGILALTISLIDTINRFVLVEGVLLVKETLVLFSDLWISSYTSAWLPL